MGFLDSKSSTRVSTYNLGAESGSLAAVLSGRGAQFAAPGSTVVQKGGVLNVTNAPDSTRSSALSADSLAAAIQGAVGSSAPSVGSPVTGLPSGGNSRAIWIVGAVVVGLIAVLLLWKR